MAQFHGLLKSDRSIVSTEAGTVISCHMSVLHLQQNKPVYTDVRVMSQLPWDENVIAT